MSVQPGHGSLVARISQPIRALVPLRHRLAVAHAMVVARAKLGRWRVQCPVCGGRFRAFLPAGLTDRPNARCPRCGALERHRLHWLFLQTNTDLFTSAPRVLHVAPEACYSHRLASLEGAFYVTADIASDRAAVVTDLTGLAFRNGSFDIILCSHVLEHIPDDAAAMAELHRALSDSGWALIQVPLDGAREHTIEDPSIVDPDERERLFGQSDHVRVYGRDYARRLRRAGFEVHESRFAFELNARAIALHGLLPEPLFVCRRHRAGADDVTPSDSRS